MTGAVLQSDPKANYLTHKREIDEAIRQTLDSGRYILGGQVSEFEREFAAYLGAKRSYPPDRKRIDIGDYYADFNRIRSTLGWRPTTSLREGLSRTLAFYQEHLPKYL